MWGSSGVGCPGVNRSTFTPYTEIWVNLERLNSICPAVSACVRVQQFSRRKQRSCSQLNFEELCSLAGKISAAASRRANSVTSQGSAVAVWVSCVIVAKGFDHKCDFSPRAAAVLVYKSQQVKVRCGVRIHIMLPFTATAASTATAARLSRRRKDPGFGS